MSLRINHNVTSLSTYANLNRTSYNMEKSIQKLSSGLRINTAADDAAGLAISEKMRSQIRGLNRAKLNAQDGISMIQTAEGGLNETESVIQRMRELAVQASNDTLTSNDRLEIQKEIKQLTEAINDISDSTEYNTKKLLNGSQTSQVSSSSKFIAGMVTGSGALGGDYSVEMSVIQGGISQMQTSQMFSDKATGELAKGSTKLEDIAQFYDVNGTFALASAQSLTVTGNSGMASVAIDGKMTLNELAAALQNAISSSSKLGIKNSTAQVISTAQSGLSGVGGYLQITSGSVGERGDFSIAGDQAIVDALGLSVSRKSANNLVQAKIQDASGNVRTVNTSSDRLSGLLDGVDLGFESTAAQIAGRGGIVDGLRFDTASKLIFNVKSDGASAGVNITASFTQDSNFSMEGIAAHINNQIAATDAANFGVEATIVDGQVRLAYNPKIANAPTEISVTGGNDVLGIEAGTYSGFVDGDKKAANQIQGFSRIASVAGAMSIVVDDGNDNETLTLGNSILAAGITGDGDLTEINSFISDSNAKLAGSNVDVRLDAVNGSIAFTSTILGNQNTNAGAVEGRVTLTNTGAIGSILGYGNGTAKGYGDTNFRLHVVDNTSQFHIGANQGQNMSISIGDMSAKALGIDRLDMSATEGAQAAIGKLDNALAKVSAERSKLGAYSNRLSYTMNNLENTATNLTDAESRIRDVDMANEMINFTSAQIMQQAGTAMLAQANAKGQSILSLLG